MSKNEKLKIFEIYRDVPIAIRHFGIMTYKEVC